MSIVDIPYTCIDNHWQPWHTNAISVGSYGRWERSSVCWKVGIWIHGRHVYWRTLTRVGTQSHRRKPLKLHQVIHRRITSTRWSLARAIDLATLSQRYVVVFLIRIIRIIIFRLLNLKLLTRRLSSFSEAASSESTLSSSSSWTPLFTLSIVHFSRKCPFQLSDLFFCFNQTFRFL